MSTEEVDDVAAAVSEVQLDGTGTVRPCIAPSDHVPMSVCTYGKNTECLEEAF